MPQTITSKTRANALRALSSIRGSRKPRSELAPRRQRPAPPSASPCCSREPCATKTGMTASPVNIVSHPLVQHKLTLMRERDRSIKGFRELTNEIGMLLCYEVTRDLPLEMVDIETPISAMKAPAIAGKKLTLAPILRAGVGFLDGMLALVPSARVAHIGLYRDPET